METFQGVLEHALYYGIGDQVLNFFMYFFPKIYQP